MQSTKKAKATAVAKAVRLDTIALALGQVTDDNVIEGVCTVIRDLKVTFGEFQTLDQRDNAPRVPAWHWKLRVARNASGAPLFKALNATAGV